VIISRLPLKEIENLTLTPTICMLNWSFYKIPFQNKNMGFIEVLRFLRWHGCFPNASMAYRVLLSIPISVASTYWSFINRNYWSLIYHTMIRQQRQNCLAILALVGEDWLQKLLMISLQRTLKEWCYSNNHYATMSLYDSQYIPFVSLLCICIIII
jgi:hypothetical protein